MGDVGARFCRTPLYKGLNPGVALGWMEWMDDRIDRADEEANRALRFMISRRAGLPADVGPIAVWLSGSGAGYVTGQIFPVDGGLTQHL
jgi:3-oxoacyl-[acyl-carrier protein] reductase